MRMNPKAKIRTYLPLMALSVALPVAAWTRSHEPLTLQAESRIWVEGNSTIRSFTCKAGDVTAVIDATPNGLAQVSAGQKGVRTVHLTMPSDKLDCGNGTMNDHMRKALKVEQNPTIEFKLSGYDVTRGGEGVTGTLKGALSLGGVQKSISIPAEGKSEAGALRVTGAYELNMTDYDLTPPSLMFGRIKVRDAVNVKFDLLLKS